MPLAILFIAVATVVFRQSVHGPLAAAGASLIIGAALWGWRAVPASVADDNLNYVAARHLIVQDLHEVEPRREFIQNNALNVKNLDI